MSHAQNLYLSNIGNLLMLAWQNLKEKFIDLVLNIFIIISVIIATVTLYYALFHLALTINFITNNIFFFNLGVRFFFYIIYIVLGVFAQILLINIFLKNHSTFKENLLIFTKNFWQMFMLNIILSLLFLAAAVPFPTAAIFFILNDSILAYISLAAAFILTILVAAFFIFSPFLLIDKKLNWLQALKESVRLAKKNMAGILIDLLLVAIIFIMLNFFSAFLLNLSLLYIMLGSILSIFMIMFCFSCLFVMYQKYKQ